MEEPLDLEKVKALVADDRVTRIRELIAAREKVDDRQAKLDAERKKLDEELAELTGVTVSNGSGRAPQKCSRCGQEGHSKRTCTNPPKE